MFRVGQVGGEFVTFGLNRRWQTERTRASPGVCDRGPTGSGLALPGHPGPGFPSYPGGLNRLITCLGAAGTNGESPPTP